MMLGRLAGKVSVGHPASCWIWTGARDSKGYGGVRRQSRVLLAHRLMYATFRGFLRPRTDLLHHTCRNPLCVNPFHLIVVTPKEHKGAHASAQCQKGHDLFVRDDGTRYCRACANRRRRERLANDPVYAERERAYQREWKRRHYVAAGSSVDRAAGS